MYVCRNFFLISIKRTLFEYIYSNTYTSCTMKINFAEKPAWWMLKSFLVNKKKSSQSILTRSFHSLALELWICIERSKSVDITANVEWNCPIDLISVARKERFINVRHQYYTEQAMSLWAASRCVVFLIEYVSIRIVSTHLGLSFFVLVNVISEKIFNKIYKFTFFLFFSLFRINWFNKEQSNSSNDCWFLLCFMFFVFL